MDRFIDEQDASRDRSASPTTYHSLIFGDAKKGSYVEVALKGRLSHRFERITRYNLGLASIGNSLETVGSIVLKWSDPTQTTHRFDGIFLAVLTSMHSLI